MRPRRGTTPDFAGGFFPLEPRRGGAHKLSAAGAPRPACPAKDVRAGRAATPFPMNSSDPTPQLPAWPFILTDVALIAAAAYIALNHDPLTVPAILAIVGCVALGALLGLVPLVARYERQKNALLDERQRSLEGLALTVTSAAEQLSIAASGLHEIAELAQKNVRHAEQLPHKLQEKIAEFQAQMATVADAEKEELERELLALRTTESERLETISLRVAKSAAEWAKLEAAAQEALAKFTARTAAVGQGLEEKITRLEAAIRATALAVPVAATTVGVAPAAVVSPLSAPAEAGGGAPDHEAVAQPPKRPRKIRREEPAVGEPVADVITEVPFDHAPTVAPSTPGTSFDEPLPVPAAHIVEIAPVAPGTSEPFSGDLAALPPPVPPPVIPPPPAAAPAPVAPAAAEMPKEPRRRAAKKPAASEEPAPALDLDESASTSAASVAERVLTSDGATRLIVTAYIGIGNRLFIRGMGPGLSWEKGVPLQFVSIGKWRWETNDATGPVEFKLYKNDELECSALGAQALDPGHQQELTAAF